MSTKTGSVRLLASLKEFEEALKSADGKLVVVDFYADWCGPCKMIAPRIQAMAEEMKDVLFFKVNVDENEETAEKAGISAMPTFKLYKDGKPVDDLTGANADKLKEKIEANK